MEVLVEFSGRRRIIRSDSGRGVLSSAAEEFGLVAGENCQVEVWDQTWQTWVELKAARDIKDKDKLRLLHVFDTGSSW